MTPDKKEQAKQSALLHTQLPCAASQAPGACLVVGHSSRSACRFCRRTPAARSTISAHASPQSLRLRRRVLTQWQAL